jgi:hypothetical protein
LIFFFISVLPVTDVVLVAASACSSSPPPELSTRSTWSEAVTLGDPDPGVGALADPTPGVASRADSAPGAASLADPDPGVGSLADPDPGAASLADPDPGVGSLADPDPGVGTRRHVPKDLWPIKAARLGNGNSWPQRPQVRRSPTEESASRLGGSGSGAGASNKRSEIY